MSSKYSCKKLSGKMIFVQIKLNEKFFIGRARCITISIEIILVHFQTKSEQKHFYNSKKSESQYIHVHITLYRRLGNFCREIFFWQSPSTTKLKLIEYFLTEINGVRLYRVVVITTKIKPGENLTAEIFYQWNTPNLL